MNSNDFVKYRAWCLFGFAILTYPAVLLFSIFYQFIKIIFGNSKCKSISNEIALVTGGGHGLGRCIAIELAKKGCHVAIADIDMEGATETAKMLIETYQIKSKAYKIDVSKFEEVVSLNDKITSDFDSAATILINNAGVLVLSNFLEPKWQEVQRMIDVNLTAHFWTNQVFLANMKAKKKGHIVAVSSLAGMLPLAFSSQYTSTKYAVRGMMRSIRLELQANRQINGDQIFASTVFPNFLQTNEKVANIVRKTGIDAFYPLMSGEEVAQRIVMGMLRNEEEIVLPGIMGLLYKFYETLPANFQDLLLFAQAYSVVRKFQKLQK